MKKALLAAIGAVGMSLALMSCSSNKEKFNWKNEDYNYYDLLKITNEKKLYVFGRAERDFESLFRGQAIQGLFSRNGGKFICAANDTNKIWLEDYQNQYGFELIDITVDEMVMEYIKEFKDKAGYVLYDGTKRETINAATTACGVLNAIPVDIRNEQKYKELGLKCLEDASNKDEAWAFNTYKNQLNNNGSLQLMPDIASGRDYSIACKYLCFYPDSKSSKTVKFRTEVHSWLKKDSPIFGWGPFNEDSHVGVSSQSGQFTIPSDHGYNLSLYAADNLINRDVFKQPNEKKGIKASKDKHYVCITRSDGDNIQTWFNYFPQNEHDLSAPREDFPMGWTINPSLKDLAPNVLDYVYRNADRNDYFVCGVSGQGYIFPQVYPSLKPFAEGLNGYLKKADLNLIQILDSGFNDNVIEMYSKIPSLKGGMYLFGNKYEAGKGSIRWSKNGKPFISCRKSLWNADPIATANEINSFKKDPTSIEGYTFVNLHPWSMTYQDVCTMVNALDEDVIVVSPEDFMDLIIDNVKKEDVTIS